MSDESLLRHVLKTRFTQGIGPDWRSRWHEPAYGTRENLPPIGPAGGS